MSEQKAEGSGQVARYYDAGANPDGAFFPGVGLRDLTQEDLDGFPEWVRESIDGCGFYSKSEPAGRAEASGSTEAESIERLNAALEENPPAAKKKGRK